MSVTFKEIHPANAEPNIVEVINPRGLGRFVIVCEHASNVIPDRYNNLGLSAKARKSHVAWDPGAIEVATALSEILDAPLVASCVSRLIYDCNRPPTAKNAIPERSEIYDIKGNTNLTKDEVSERSEKFYFPFRNALSECLGSHSRRVGSSILVSIHTFTPIYHGRTRSVDLGVIHDSDNRMADGMLTALGTMTKFKVERNQPYGPRDGVTHTLKEHGNKRGIANVMMEIKSDLVATFQQQSEIGTVLASALKYSAGNLNGRTE